jgi:hypothetical protein
MEAEGNRQLALDGDNEVGKSRRRAAVERVKICRHVGQHLGALRYAETQPGLGAADDLGSFTDGPIAAILRLQAPVRNDPARIGGYRGDRWKSQRRSWDRCRQPKPAMRP